jgi:hypothetical protein
VDFKLYARVLWRFRLLVIAGLVLALALALVSTVSVGRNGMSYRESELWSSTLRLLVTQSGFPEGRLYAQKPLKPGEEATTTDEPPAAGDVPVADPNRFNALAILYAELAASDPVRQVMRRNGPVRGKLIATALRDEQSGTLLPLIDLAAISTSPRAAITLAVRGANALNTFLQEQQRANRVPAADRVVVQTINQPRGALLFQPRSKTMPIVIFLVVMLAVVGLAFLLENLRPRAEEAKGPQKSDIADAAVRRTA